MTGVLDQGYVTRIEHWGSDERIIESARMSTAKGFLGWEPEFVYTCPRCAYVMVLTEDIGPSPVCPACAPLEPIVMLPNPNIEATQLTVPPVHMVLDQQRTHRGDEKLLRYLYTHGHMTPFEMAGITIEVQAPIFVFREWHRHRTQSYNELSARYTELPDMFYLPAESRIVGQSNTNKQASGEELDEGLAEWARAEIALSQQRARIAYEHLLKAGVAREVARVVIPVAQYSRMRASANLRNWLAFCTLRMAPNAQWEIRQYANAVGVILAECFPRTWALYMEGRS